MSNAIEHMRIFAEVQAGLVFTLYNPSCGLRQLELNGIPKGGSLVLNKDIWSFQRHGSGVLFKANKDGTVIDAHLGMLKAPDAFDAWRLLQYFESVGVGSVEYANVSYGVAAERQVESLLEKLCKEGHLVALGNGLYKLSVLTDSPSP